MARVHILHDTYSMSTRPTPLQDWYVQSIKRVLSCALEWNVHFIEKGLIEPVLIISGTIAIFNYISRMTRPKFTQIDSIFDYFDQLTAYFRSWNK